MTWNESVITDRDKILTHYVSILHPLKTQENLWFSIIFRDGVIGNIVQKWVKTRLTH